RSSLGGGCLRYCLFESRCPSASSSRCVECDAPGVFSVLVGHATPCLLRHGSLVTSVDERPARGPTRRSRAAWAPSLGAGERGAGSHGRQRVAEPFTSDTSRSFAGGQPGELADRIGYQPAQHEQWTCDENPAHSSEPALERGPVTTAQWKLKQGLEEWTFGVGDPRVPHEAVFEREDCVQSRGGRVGRARFYEPGDEIVLRERRAAPVGRLPGEPSLEIEPAATRLAVAEEEPDCQR